MRSLVTLLFLSALTTCSGQSTWMRYVELMNAYHHASRDWNGDPQHDILLFYANDSVVQVTMGSWEGAFEVAQTKSPVQLVNAFVDEFHCDPESFSSDNGVSVYHLVEDSVLEWHHDRSPITFVNDGSACIYGKQRFIRIKRWNRIVLPRWKNRRTSRYCIDEPE
jgi:hypothetical protein